MPSKGRPLEEEEEDEEEEGGGHLLYRTFKSDTKTRCSPTTKF
jgi:hypothetical protein